MRKENELIRLKRDLESVVKTEDFEKAAEIRDRIKTIEPSSIDEVEELLGQSGEWLKGTGPESDVVISSRVRLARNLHRFPFLTWRPRRSLGGGEVRPPAPGGRQASAQLVYWSLGELSPVERRCSSSAT